MEILEAQVVLVPMATAEPKPALPTRAPSFPSLEHAPTVQEI